MTIGAVCTPVTAVHICLTFIHICISEQKGKKGLTFVQERSTMEEFFSEQWICFHIVQARTFSGIFLWIGLPGICPENASEQTKNLERESETEFVMSLVTLSELRAGNVRQSSSLAKNSTTLTPTVSSSTSISMITSTKIWAIGIMTVCVGVTAMCGGVTFVNVCAKKEKRKTGMNVCCRNI